MKLREFLTKENWIQFTAARMKEWDPDLQVSVLKDCDAKEVRACCWCLTGALEKLLTPKEFYGDTEFYTDEWNHCDRLGKNLMLAEYQNLFATAVLRMISWIRNRHPDFWKKQCEYIREYLEAAEGWEFSSYQEELLGILQSFNDEHTWEEVKEILELADV